MNRQIVVHSRVCLIPFLLYLMNLFFADKKKLYLIFLLVIMSEYMNFFQVIMSRVDTNDGERVTEVEVNSSPKNTDEQPDQNAKPPLQSKRKKKSDVWTYFIVTETRADGFKTCKCKYCGHIYSKICSRTGTGNMSRHLLACPRRSTRDVGQMMVGKIGQSSKFDDAYFRELLCSAVVVHDLPFSFIEYKCVRMAFEYLRPDLNLISRNTLKADVLKFFEREKGRIRSMLEMAPGRICLTSDCWSSITSDGYITLTAHFIDMDWVLQKRVLNFSLMPSPHTGVALSNKLLSMLSGWGIKMKLFSLTLDNASSNDVCADFLITQLKLNDALVSNGEFFHIRCCAHIINLVVQDGLKDIDGVVVKIRESVKFVRGSQMRKQNFFECVGMVPSLSDKKGLRQDVPTRWNSTFMMLDSALYYKKTFMNLQLIEPNYLNCPSSIEWDKVENIRNFLGVFYEISNLFSGSLYPTANLYFRPIVACYASLIKSRDSGDEYIKKMATMMLIKFEKYWLNFSLILTIAVVIDPRYKLQFVDFSYKKLYGADSTQYMQVKEKLFALFEEYSKLCDNQVRGDTDSMNSSGVPFESEMSTAMAEVITN